MPDSRTVGHRRRHRRALHVRGHRARRRGRRLHGAHAVSDRPSASGSSSTGYIVPANTEVAASDVFLQPGRQPEHAQVFNSAVRAIDVPPLISTRAQLEQLVAARPQALIDVPVLDDLDERLQAIDEKSRTVLDPESVEPSESRSESGSPGSTSGNGPTSAATTG